MLRSLLPIALLTAACTVPDPEAVTLAPTRTVRLPEVLSPGTLAVVEFEDRRPEVERRQGSLQDTFISSEFLPPGHYWYQRSEELDELPDAVVNGRELFLRITGEEAFRWHDFPPVRPGGRHTDGVAKGLSDWFALAVEQRGIVPRVIRVGSWAEAQEAGAEFVLEGRIDHFAGGMTEVHAEDFERLDDRRDHLLFSRLGLLLRLHRMPDQHLLWDREYVDPRDAEDDSHLFDLTEDFRGVTTGVGGPRLLRLDPEHQPRAAFEDMVAHVERRLQGVTASSLAGIESALQAGYPVD